MKSQIQGYGFRWDDVMINSYSSLLHRHEATCTNRYLQNHARYQLWNKDIMEIYLFLWNYCEYLFFISYFCMPQKAALAIMTETHKNIQFTEVFPAYLTQGAFSLPIICWLDSFSHRNTNSVVGVTDCFCVGNGLLLLKIVLFPTALPSI